MVQEESTAVRCSHLGVEKVKRPHPGSFLSENQGSERETAMEDGKQNTRHTKSSSTSLMALRLMLAFQDTEPSRDRFKNPG